MFEEDLFKDAKYCVSCNKFYVTAQCPFCTPNKTTAPNPAATATAPTNNGLAGLNINKNVQPPAAAKESKKSSLDYKVEELSLEIERLRHENKEKKEQIAKGKELELKFNILADKFERLNQKEKVYYKEQPSRKSPKSHWFGRNDIKIKKSKGGGTQPTSRNNGDDAETKLLLKKIESLSEARIQELNSELEQLQQKVDEKDQQVLKTTSESSKLTGMIEQQKDELERLRLDIQDRDRVIMQISLTLSSAISQALTHRGQEKLQEFTTTHPPSNTATTTPNKNSNITLYALLGSLNAAIFGYFGYAFIYKKGIVSLIIAFFKGT